MTVLHSSSLSVVFLLSVIFVRGGITHFLSFSDAAKEIAQRSIPAAKDAAKTHFESNVAIVGGLLVAAGTAWHGI